ncbi:hypothetical protein JCGZ_10958 [Jatropha curcas]|uniref:Uncharacterized protein n=1 Tax=Jatropha curcas TaxID=180498 RepID=A0A067LQ26_JATCU|nr:hypothetical protein JCGZ_10958 [Jatropha curcas]
MWWSTRLALRITFPASSHADGTSAARIELVCADSTALQIFRRISPIPSTSGAGDGLDRLLSSTRTSSLHRFVISPEF